MGYRREPFLALIGSICFLVFIVVAPPLLRVQMRGRGGKLFKKAKGGEAEKGAVVEQRGDTGTGTSQSEEGHHMQERMPGEGQARRVKEMISGRGM